MSGNNITPSTLSAIRSVLNSSETETSSSSGSDANDHGHNIKALPQSVSSVSFESENESIDFSDLSSESKDFDSEHDESFQETQKTAGNSSGLEKL